MAYNVTIVVGVCQRNDETGKEVSKLTVIGDFAGQPGAVWGVAPT